MGEQKGPLSGVVPLIWHFVNSLSGIPGAVELAVARYEAALYVDVPVFVSVALTPGAV